jgi:hypothetical protein
MLVEAVTRLFTGETPELSWMAQREFLPAALLRDQILRHRRCHMWKVARMPKRFNKSNSRPAPA